MGGGWGHVVVGDVEGLSPTSRPRHPTAQLGVGGQPDRIEVGGREEGFIHALGERSSVVSDAVRHQISHTGLASPQGGSLFDRRSGVKLARVQLEPVIWVVV